MIPAIRRIAAFIIAAAWRAGREPEHCHLCRKPLTDDEVLACTACVSATSDQIIRERMAELDVHEAISMARGIALREGDRDLANALQAVLLLHLTGGLQALAPTFAALTRDAGASGAVN